MHPRRRDHRDLPVCRGPELRKLNAAERAALLALALGSCAHVEPPPPPLAVADRPLTIELQSAKDAAELPRLATLAAEATAPLARWGGLRAPTTIQVVPDHAALEQQTHHPGFPWLRAWARYDVVFLQAPRSWGPFETPSDPQLRDLLTHELTHCLMYQAIASPDSWQGKRIPLWFREGFASWTANQGQRRLSQATLTHVLQSEPTLDPIGDAETLLRPDEPVVYAAAHWAFASLAARGEQRLTNLLTGMHDGWSFEVAFARAYGLEAGAFEKLAVEALRHPR